MRDPRAGTAPLLQVVGLEKSYGSVRALAGVDITLDRGSVLGVVGPNGAGKTTLMSLIAGLLKPDSGRVIIDGRPSAGRTASLYRGIGVATQEVGVYPPLTVEENLVFFGRLFGLRREPLRRRVTEISDALGLTSLLARQARELSGGERRRLHTAIALVHEPSLVLLDEPTAGVDVETRARITSYVRRLADRGSAVFYSSHYLQEIEEIADQVLMLRQGEAVAFGPLSGIIERHGTGLVEMSFAGDPPDVRWPGPTMIEGGVVHVQASRPSDTAAELLGLLGNARDRLVSIRIVQPSLESAYLIASTSNSALSTRPS